MDGFGIEVGSVTGLMFVGSQQVVPLVVLQRNGLAVALLVFSDHFEGTGGSLSFESTDCRGTPLLAGPFDDTLILPGTVEGPGITVYVPDTSATLRSVTVQSVLQVGECFTAPFGLVSAVPAVPLVDLDTLFVQPLRIP